MATANRPDVLCARCATVAPHKGRGLCLPCYGAAKWDGSLDNYPRRLRPRDEVVEDWRWISDELPVGASHTKRIQIAAERLGMTFSALEVALRRAGIYAEKRAS